jgi:hypothetical protein
VRDTDFDTIRTRPNTTKRPVRAARKCPQRETGVSTEALIEESMVDMVLREQRGGGGGGGGGGEMIKAACAYINLYSPDSPKDA